MVKRISILLIFASVLLAACGEKTEVWDPTGAGKGEGGEAKGGAAVPTRGIND